MKDLYISDLDGTLLTDNAQLAPQTACELRKMIDSGLDFTIATARTAATVTEIMKDAGLRLPAVLMNGAIIYDMAKGRYLRTETIAPEDVRSIIEYMYACELQSFIYTVEDDVMTAYYEKLSTDHMRCFYEERKNRYNKRFVQINSLYDTLCLPVVYFSLLNTKDRLDPFYRKVCEIDGITVVYYRDVYSKELWYLEILSGKASKRSGAEFLRSMLKPERMICFGDNLNDLPLFEVCERKFAVSNAAPELKRAADGVIGSNMENGVAEFLKREFYENK